MRTLMERTYYHLAMAIGGQTRDNLDVVIRRQLITDGVETDETYLPFLTRLDAAQTWFVSRARAAKGLLSALKPKAAASAKAGAKAKAKAAARAAT